MRGKNGFDSQMQEIILGMDGSEPKSLLLLHVCCAPCSSAVLERLAGVFRIIACFDNPNIDSATEHDLRAGETLRLTELTGWTEQVIVTPYDPAVFRSAVRGLEGEPEGGSRCAVCFRLRLARSARKAAELGCSFFTTTLTLSPRKDAAMLNEIGREAGEAAGVRFLPSDFKKRGGYQRSILLSRQFGLYRQDYCGCAFSRKHPPGPEGEGPKIFPS